MSLLTRLPVTPPLPGGCGRPAPTLATSVHNLLVHMLYHLTRKHVSMVPGLFLKLILDRVPTFLICRKSFAINLSLLNVLYPRVGCGSTKNVTLMNFGSFFSTTISTTQAGTVSFRRTPSVSPPASRASSRYRVRPPTWR